MKTLANVPDKREILARLGGMRADSQRLWGRMSPHQMICHLSDSFRVSMGEMKASPATGFLQRTVVKWGALYFPMTWPKNVPTRPVIDQAAGGGSCPSDFNRDVQDLVSLTDRFVREPRDFVWHAHPFFGNMTARDWMRWGYLHMDHHLRQFGR